MALMLLTLLVIIALGQKTSSSPLQSPTSTHTKQCQTSEYMEQLLSKNVTWKQQLDETNRDWMNYSISNAKLSNYRSFTTPTTSNTPPLIAPRLEIPIIWHAIHLSTYTFDGNLVTTYYQDQDLRQHPTTGFYVPKQRWVQTQLL